MKINLIYWHEFVNFGDTLSPYIVSKLSTEAIEPKKCALSWVNLLKFILKYPHKIKSLSEYALPFQKNLLSTGSVINLGNSKSKIWGSGFMNESDLFFGGEAYAVRGKYTAHKLSEAGRRFCDVWGDPALLLPLIYTPAPQKRHDLGIVAHWREVEDFKRGYPSLHVIDTRNANVEDVIDEIASCRRIVSSSLHGIITAHAYNVPALWIKKGYINTDGFKFRDYFSSVGIREYEGFSRFEETAGDKLSLDKFFTENRQLALPRKDLDIIRRDLLKSAPFPLRDEYTRLIRGC